MKLKTIFFLSIVFAVYSCSGVKYGVYKSTCEIYHVPELILLLNEDKTFEYKRPYVDEKITGTWEINENKDLILKSDMFKSTDDIDPGYKYTNIEGNDIYKISGNKLFIYSANGEYSSDKCYLIHINDDVTLFKDYKFFKNQ